MRARPNAGKPPTPWFTRSRVYPQSGPEPESKPYGNLLNFADSNCFLLNVLWSVCWGLWNLGDLGGFDVYNFIYSFNRGFGRRIVRPRVLPMPPTAERHAMMEQRIALETFEARPRRIFLDSSTLQALRDYGELIYDNVEPVPGDRVYSIPGGFNELDALRDIFFVNRRASSEFALSENSFKEVAAKNDRAYIQWAYDVLDHWEGCVAAYRESPFSGDGQVMADHLDDRSFGYLGENDRLLLQDAVALECDAFLTMDRKLAKNANHLKQHTCIRVLLPSQFWDLLEPWACLFA